MPKENEAVWQIMSQQKARSQNRNELELLDEWYAYNSYVRKKYLRILEKLPEDELLRDRGASFPSVLDVFTHILDAYRWWFLYVYHDRIHERKRLRGSGLKLKEVVGEEHKIDSHIRKFLHELSLSDLEKPVIYHEVSHAGKRSKKIEYGGKVRDMLWHMVEEELQHRGELNALLWQIDKEPPITGWAPWDPTEKDPAAQTYWKNWQRSKSRSKSLQSK